MWAICIYCKYFRASSCAKIELTESVSYTPSPRIWSLKHTQIGIPFQIRFVLLAPPKANAVLRRRLQKAVATIVLLDPVYLGAQAFSGVRVELVEHRDHVIIKRFSRYNQLRVLSGRSLLHKGMICILAAIPPLREPAPGLFAKTSGCLLEINRRRNCQQARQKRR